MTSRTLTGGSGDIKPQYMKFAGVTPAAAQYGIETIQLPRPRITSRNKRAIVYEFLKVYFYPNISQLADTAQTQYMAISTSALNRSGGDACTLGTIVLDMQRPAVIAQCIKQNNLATNGATSSVYPHTVDLTDGAGNGVLVATDALFLIVGDVGGAGAGTGVCTVLYRLTEISITEYLGIVQSQQGLIIV